MKVSVQEVIKKAQKILSEGKKKKDKAKELAYKATPEAYKYSDSFDFSAPLGAYNRYKGQGAVNWGPHTGPGTKIDDRLRDPRSNQNAAEDLEEKSSWQKMSEMIEPKKPTNIWEAAKQKIEKKDK